MIKYCNILSLFLLVILLVGCESERRFPPKGYIPNTPSSTVQLEAQYFWTAQDKLTSGYWKDADYVSVSLQNLETNNLYPDGILNANGTYNGLTDFNEGINPELKIKAGYDADYLYILVEWKDTTANADYLTWFWDGPEDPLKTDTTNDWTSQNNNDNISLLFEKSDQTFEMWKWSLAYTAPFDMGLQLAVDESGEIITSEIETISRNTSSDTPRGGPKYQWNDERQEITLPDGSIRILDPSRYLLAEYTSPLQGNVAAGQTAFNVTADCRFCHGPNGNGEADGFTNGGPLNLPFINKYTREGLYDFINSTAHEGRGSQYFGKIKYNEEAVENLLSFLRANSGIPGHILEMPDNAPAVHALSNISVGGINDENDTYKVLFRRSLKANAPGDVEFVNDQTYKFSVRVADNDEINYVGATGIELIFESNEL